MTTSRQIIIDLIDKKVINGEQAFVLINDIIQSEILESWKTLNNKENIDFSFNKILNNDYINPASISSPPWMNTTTYTGYNKADK